ncbi:MAG: hypothetical protein ABEJ85_03010 [Haloarculaceae archaeon]
MIRAVLTVALAVAVLGVALPAVEQASTQRGDTATRRAVDDLVSAARALAADSDALPPNLSTARRSLTLDLPTNERLKRGLATLRIERPPSPRASDADANVSVGTGSQFRTGTRLVWRVRGATTHVRQVGDVRLRPAGWGARRTPDAVTLRTGGRRRLVLELVRVDGHRVVWVHVGDVP